MEGYQPTWVLRKREYQGEAACEVLSKFRTRLTQAISGHYSEDMYFDDPDEPLGEEGAGVLRELRCKLEDKNRREKFYYHRLHEGLVYFNDEADLVNLSRKGRAMLFSDFSLAMHTALSSFSAFKAAKDEDQDPFEMLLQDNWGFRIRTELLIMAANIAIRHIEWFNEDGQRLTCCWRCLGWNHTKEMCRHKDKSEHCQKILSWALPSLYQVHHGLRKALRVFYWMYGRAWQGMTEGKLMPDGRERVSARSSQVRAPSSWMKSRDWSGKGCTRMVSHGPSL